MALQRSALVGVGLSGGASVLLSLGLLLLTASVFLQTVGHDFVNYDDPLYVTHNPIVQRGLTAEGVRWAFNTGHAGNWHPVTWLSHMLDAELFGPRPAGHHLHNVILHGAGTVLLFIFLLRTTGRRWPAFFAAALFSIHPLRAESVAWVSERKDVLSALFWMLTMIAYVRYAKAPSMPRYGLVVVLLALGLMAKPMLVTLPFALLLLDFWPLGRFGFHPGVSTEAATARPIGLKRALVEKLPLILLALISSAVTFFVQATAGAVESMERYPVSVRLSNAVVSYCLYLLKTVWPARLTVVYPEPRLWPPAILAGSLAILAALTWAAFRVRRRAPWFPVGWFWFLGTLVPVIGLVQVGNKSMADRYSYIPSIGLLILIVWGAGALIRTRRVKVWLAVASGLLVIAVWSAVSAVQVGVWRNSETLFSHALRVSPAPKGIVHYNLGLALADAGDYAGAFPHFAAALEANPNLPRAHNNIGVYHARRGNLEAAAGHFREAVRMKPGYAAALDNLRLAEKLLGKRDRP